MKLNKHLPKYKKQWLKEKALTPLYKEEGGVYILIKSSTIGIYNDLVHTYVFNQYNPITNEELYFFELFKYLVKYKHFYNEPRIMAIRTKNGRIPLSVSNQEILKHIKIDLITKQSKIIGALKPNIKMAMLAKYSKFLDSIFKLVEVPTTEISLVIQKKIGYNYYENIKYY